MRPKNEVTPEMWVVRDKWLEIISEKTGVPCVEIMGKGRRQNVVIARHLLAWALYQLEKYTLVNVGTLTSRHHSSIFHSLQITNFIMATSKPYGEIIKALAERKDNGGCDN